MAVDGGDRRDHSRNVPRQSAAALTPGGSPHQSLNGTYWNTIFIAATTMMKTLYEVPVASFESKTNRSPALGSQTRASEDYQVQQAIHHSSKRLPHLY